MSMSSGFVIFFYFFTNSDTTSLSILVVWGKYFLPEKSHALLVDGAPRWPDLEEILQRGRFSGPTGSDVRPDLPEHLQTVLLIDGRPLP